MKKFFLSFSGGSDNYLEALKVISEQARKLNIFDGVIEISDDVIFNHPEHQVFSNKYKNFILDNKRGFGYWIWKSYLINYYLKQLDINDILIYADSGCRLTDNKHMLRLINQAELSDFIVCAYAGHNIKSYTSKCVLDKFDQSLHDEVMIESTVLAIKCNKLTLDFMEKWADFCQSTENLVDPIISDEPKGFIDHRHDQSAFSLIYYKNFNEFLPMPGAAFFLHNAIKPLRLRNGKKTEYDFTGLIKTGSDLSPIGTDLIEKIIISSYFESFNDDFLPLENLIQVKYKLDFSFHTNLEINPHIIIIFKKDLLVNFCVVENRKYLESRIESLMVEVSKDTFEYSEVMTYKKSFGGLYDENPLVFSLPKTPIRSIKFTNLSIIENYFHLKSIYLYP